MSFNIEVQGGTSVRLPTAGKYCDRDIVITATGGGSAISDNRHLYQRVEYIVGDGNQYLLTDFIANNESGMELIASFSSYQDRVPMGVRADDGDTRFYVPYVLKLNSIVVGFNTYATVSKTASINTKYRLQNNFLNSRCVTVRTMAGTARHDASVSGTLPQYTIPVAIFGYCRNEGVISSLRAMTCYGAKCTQGSHIARDYYPSYRKSDGEIGLYEKYTGQFLTNMGTGAFTKGPDIDWDW